VWRGGVPIAAMAPAARDHSDRVTPTTAPGPNLQCINNIRNHVATRSLNDGTHIAGQPAYAIDFHARRSRDHVPALTAHSTSRSHTGSTPAAARTTAPPISMAIVVALRVAASAAVPAGRGSVTTGTNSGAVFRSQAESFLVKLPSRPGAAQGLNLCDQKAAGRRPL
jgi:hypothetical protein